MSSVSRIAAGAAAVPLVASAAQAAPIAVGTTLPFTGIITSAEAF